MGIGTFILAIGVVCGSFLLGPNLSIAGMLIISTIAAVALMSSGYIWNNTTNPATKELSTNVMLISSVGTVFLWISWLLFGII